MSEVGEQIVLLWENFVLKNMSFFVKSVIF